MFPSHQNKPHKNRKLLKSGLYLGPTESSAVELGVCIFPKLHVSLFGLYEPQETDEKSFPIL